MPSLKDNSNVKSKTKNNKSTKQEKGFKSIWTLSEITLPKCHLRNVHLIYSAFKPIRKIGKPFFSLKKLFFGAFVNPRK